MDKFNVDQFLWDRLTVNLRIDQRYWQVRKWTDKHDYIEITSSDLTITRWQKGDHIIRFDHSDGSLRSEY